MPFEIDELKYSISGDPYVINDWITITLPTVKETKDFGEDNYNHVLNAFVQKPYDIAVELDDNGIDYQSITDWDLFSRSIIALPMEYTSILIKDVDFTKFRRLFNPENQLWVLVNLEQPEQVIDEAIYRKIVGFLRYVHFISEKVEYDVGNGIAKKFLLDRMRRKQQKLLRDYKNGKIKKHSRISDMIKYCVNNPGFKYDYEHVMDMKLNLLYESYYFIVHGNERRSLLSGVYAGTIDPDKMKDKSILDIIPDLHK